MDNSAIEVFPEPHIEGPISDADRVLQVERELLNVGMAVEGKQRALLARTTVLRLRSRCQHRPSEVKASKGRYESGHGGPDIGTIVGLKCTCAVALESRRGPCERTRIGWIQTDGVEGRIGDSEVEILGQEGVLKRDPGLDVVFALHVGHVRTKSRVRQLSLLIERRRSTAGNH